MKMHQNITVGMKLFPVVLLIFCLGCNIPTDEKHEADTTKVTETAKTSDRNCMDCVAEYCEKIAGFVQTFRKTITNIGTNDFTTLNRTLADVEHSVHEMKEKAGAGKKEELHHAHESIMRQMKRLNEEAAGIS